MNYLRPNGVVEKMRPFDLIREGVPIGCWQRASDYLLLYRGVE
jgi:hypothetical protein